MADTYTKTGNPGGKKGDGTTRAILSHKERFAISYRLSKQVNADSLSLFLLSSSPPFISNNITYKSSMR